MKYGTIQAKTILSKPIVADEWFHINRSMNLYRGCEHGCVYCDGFCQYYRVDDFYTHIRAKENAPEIIRKELKRMGYTSRTALETETLWAFLPKEDAKRLAMKTPRKIVIGAAGGISDCYQPAEKEYKITRQVLEVLLDFEIPTTILTKSNLILRDLDLLKQIHEVAFANVLFTITLDDYDTQKAFEPRSSTSDERFKALKEIRKAGLFGGVMATPIIPWIGDSTENLTSLTKKAKESKAEFIQFGGMTLKAGRQKDYFLNVTKKRFPDAFEKIKHAYSNNHTYGIPIWDRLPFNIMKRGYEICNEVGIEDRSIRHTLPGDHEINYVILRNALSAKYYLAYFHGCSRDVVRPFHELAAKIESGVENMETLREEGRIATSLNLNDRMLRFVEEILDSGKSNYISQLQNTNDIKLFA